MIIPAITDMFAHNADWQIFLVCAILVGGFGLLTSIACQGQGRPQNFREAILFVNTAWLVFSFAGAVPMWASELNISFTDAFFESASGLTTTGSTILTGIETLPPGILLWRALLQWIGGIGVVSLAIWLLPSLRVSGNQLFALETSETATKPYGRIAPFLFRLLFLYSYLSVSCCLLYLACGMTLFDAVVHAMTTVSTGGFSTSDASFGQFQGLSVYWVATVFMLASSVPFLYLIRSFENRRFEFDVQILLLFVLITTGAFGVLYFERFVVHDTPFHMLTLAVFNVVSVVSTTGYGANDYLQFGAPVIAIFFVLTFFGGCAGSTSGGFKMFRIAVLLSYIRVLLQRMVRPHRVIAPKYHGKRISISILEGTFVFAVLYSATFVLFAVFYLFLQMNLETALSASATALANVGPGIGDIIGPAGNFQNLPDAAKWLLAIQMILGRLEILGGLLLFTPDFWRER
ncbi:TrkH family potassium uptake protein [Roseibium hamelinense]|nr:TrkH family potassium uptake protein [Roseibium hamelinense]